MKIKSRNTDGIVNSHSLNFKYIKEYLQVFTGLSSSVSPELNSSTGYIHSENVFPTYETAAEVVTNVPPAAQIIVHFGG